ncbi:17284_t:CDS:10 [Acaulospora colombiana]|uniref:17284_t:CDS:1 n=1 Tax=Acaulospora colombiana TaxID=27376 RepID=A0ACA9K115_9GLOM|nr:17284_t:CDS:10 [Acaulospora colombiana]
MPNESIDLFDNLKPFLENVIARPEIFIAAEQSLSLEALNITKKLYDFCKSEEQKDLLEWREVAHSNPVEELRIEDLSNEQIWNELSTQNMPFLEYVNEQLDDLDELVGGREQHEEYDKDQAVFDFSDTIEMQHDGSEIDSEEINPLDEEIESEEEEDQQMDEELTDDDEGNTAFHSELDDQFFNLAEFNETTGADKPFEINSRSNASDEDDIDYFADPNELANKDELNDIMYEDFFDPPKKKKNHKSNRKRILPHDDLTGSKVNLNPDSGKDEHLTHVVRNLFAQDESDDEDRPLNSLLEEDLEFDYIAKPVPVITEEVTEKLEDMIKRRILDETFDDVERKRDPNFRPFLPSKLVEVSTEKSKKSLAEIYEEDYVMQTTKDLSNEKDEALKKEHQEIENSFKELCYKLDALSNFHYTPKPPKPEITVVTDVPAIAMEEVIPINVSDATLLAPEEVYDKKRREVKGDTEMDLSDKKRSRAEKKRIKKKERALKEREKKIIEKMNPGMGNKHAKKKILDTLIGQKNVTIIDKDGTLKSAVKKSREVNMRSTNLKL